MSKEAKPTLTQGLNETSDCFTCQATLNGQSSALYLGGEWWLQIMIRWAWETRPKRMIMKGVKGKRQSEMWSPGVRTAWTLTLMIGRKDCRLLKWFSGRAFRGTVSPKSTLSSFQGAIRSGIDGASLILERNIWREGMSLICQVD